MTVEGRGLIAHEWVEPIGGSENVVDAFARLYPYVDLYSLWINARDRYPTLRHFESCLATSALRDRKAAALPFMSRTWRAADLSGYDWALISSHAFAHHLGSGARQRHLRRFVYVHSPARYLWAPEHDPRGSSPVVRAAAPLLRRQDRRWVRPGAYAANSRFIRERIRRAWGVDSEVIHPPVAVTELQATPDWTDELDEDERRILDGLPDGYVLGASRFVGYKRFDTVLGFAAATRQPVVLAGSGPLEAELRSAAAALDVPSALVVGPSNRLLRALIQRAAVVVYPPVEDFGIIAAEATALGTPVIVNEVGGARETVQLTKGGVSIDVMDPSGWRQALHRTRELDMDEARRLTRALSEESFETNISGWMDSR